MAEAKAQEVLPDGLMEAEVDTLPPCGRNCYNNPQLEPGTLWLEAITEARALETKAKKTNTSSC